jgi:hypothetical protein
MYIKMNFSNKLTKTTCIHGKIDKRIIFDIIQQMSQNVHKLKVVFFIGFK